MSRVYQPPVLGLDTTRWRTVNVSVPVEKSALFDDDQTKFTRRSILDIVKAFDNSGITGTEEFYNTKDGAVSGINTKSFKDVEKPTPAAAVASYFATSLYKDHLKGANTATKYLISVMDNGAPKQLPIYCYKGYTGPTDKEILSTNDAQCMGVLALNKMAIYCLDKNKRIPLMGPMRVQITDEGIEAICDALGLDSKVNKDKASVIRSLNYASVKNPGPFFDVESFNGTIAVASKIAQIGNTAAPSKEFVSIQLKQIRRIMNAKEVTLESEAIFDIINAFGHSDKLEFDDVKEILLKAKMMKTRANIGYYSDGMTMSSARRGTTEA